MNQPSKKSTHFMENIGLNIREVQKEFLIYNIFSKGLLEKLKTNNLLQKYDEMIKDKNYFETDFFSYYQSLLIEVISEAEKHIKLLSRHSEKILILIKLDEEDCVIEEFFFINYVLLTSYNEDKIYFISLLLKSLNIDKIVNYIVYVDYKILFFLNNLEYRKKIDYMQKFFNILRIDPNFIIQIISKFQNIFKFDEKDYLFIKNFYTKYGKKQITKEIIKKVDVLFSKITNYYNN